MAALTSTSACRPAAVVVARPIARPAACRPAAAVFARPAARRRASSFAVRAQEGDDKAAPAAAAADEEARLEALEGGMRAKKGVKAAAEQAAAARRRGAPALEVWPEGQLLPSDWESLNPAEKAAAVWTGERGFLFWANKAAYYSLGGLVVAWILFRFVGPALGLYRLADDFAAPV
jgi:hypothetical protein